MTLFCLGEREGVTLFCLGRGCDTFLFFFWGGATLLFGEGDTFLFGLVKLFCLVW